ncbi:hypothetical protein [Kamptonema sp. UHCC 0994]|uniref:hypothetical protein n=1 Tax=Kamptonema sp. UHCC 0994 TaxID=3031329 RepID=UPI0023B8C7F7|nr:hypothetical protein [Kamptonema sp. UHCC 0994]MDF0551822.1 hypothetical protein [Kamptonema sp. UHCC 0994]
MIYNLQTAIANLLKTELSEYLPRSEQHFTTKQLTESTSQPLPKISIYASNFSLEQNLKDSKSIKTYPEASRQEITVIREFEQDFFIDIYDNDLGSIEKLASLILGIILTNSEDLLQEYNVTKPTHYQENANKNPSTTTTHLINQINFLEGNYKTSVTPMIFELKWQVKGNIKLVRTVAGVPIPIREIILEKN